MLNPLPCPAGLPSSIQTFTLEYLEITVFHVYPYSDADLVSIWTQCREIFSGIPPKLQRVEISFFYTCPARLTEEYLPKIVSGTAQFLILDTWKRVAREAVIDEGGTEGCFMRTEGHYKDDLRMI